MQPTQLPLGFLLADAHRLYRRRFERAAAETDLGLTSGEARTLAYVNAYPGLRQSTLADRMNVEPMTLVGFLDGLEAKGLVARGADPADRRCKLVATTDRAQAAATAIEAAGWVVRREACQGFTDEEVATLRGLLARIAANLSAAAAAPATADSAS